MKKSAKDGSSKWGGQSGNSQAAKKSCLISETIKANQALNKSLKEPKKRGKKFRLRRNSPADNVEERGPPSHGRNITLDVIAKRKRNDTYG